MSLLLLASVVCCESYSTSSKEDRDVPSEYSSLEAHDVPSKYSPSEGCEGRTNLYTTLLSSTLDNHHDREEEEEKEEWLNLDLGEPCEVLRTEGGVVRVWMHDNVDRAIRNVAVGVAELELEEDGLLLPNYANVPKVAYVTQGIYHIIWLVC